MPSWPKRRKANSDPELLLTGGDEREEIARLVRETIAEVGATSRAQMGAVMKALGPKVAGRADGKTLSQEVQRQLG